MATQSQIDANRRNATHSTGPRTEAGKANSSRNALTMGLYTRQDYVEPEERDLYKEFCQTMYDELCPASLLEETLVSEITGASWRLRRCNAVEGKLALEDEAVRPYPHEGPPCDAAYRQQDPMLDEKTEKQRRSLERARSSAHSLLHRSINQLRKLQTERLNGQKAQLRQQFAERKAAEKAAKQAAADKASAQKAADNAFGAMIERQLDAIMNCPAPDWAAIDLSLALETDKGANLTPQQAANRKRFASICSSLDDRSAEDEKWLGEIAELSISEQDALFGPLPSLEKAA